MKIYAIFLTILLLALHTFTQISAQALDEATNSSTPENKSVKSIAAGFGLLSLTHKSDVSNTKAEGSISDLGVSIGLKAIEHFYQSSPLNTGVGYYVSGNTILGFLLSAYAKKSDSAQTTNVGTSTLSSALVLVYGEQGTIKTISQNINFGINFYSKAPILTTNIGVGPSVNFLFYNFSEADTRFENSIGVGVSLDMEFHFPITQLIAIPFIIHGAYYPLHFNSSDGAVKYGIESWFLVAIQLGATFTY